MDASSFPLIYSQTKSSVPPNSPQESINEFIIQKLNPLLVVDFGLRYFAKRNETKRYFAKWYFAKRYFAKRYFAKWHHR